MYQIYRAAIYARKSVEDGDRAESDSIVNQRNLINLYVQNTSDIEIIDCYVDDGYTGTNFERPAFQRLLSDIESGVINCVIVKDLSRLGRDYIDTGRFLERYFPQHGVRFIAVSDSIDSANEQYDMSIPYRNIFNSQYPRDISRKIIGSFRTKQKRGEFIGAFAPYGYLKDPENKNHLVVDEYASEVVKRIFRLYADGVGQQTICRILNDDNILCPTEYKKSLGMKYTNGNRLELTKYWTYSTIRRILGSEVYIGNLVQHRFNCSQYDYTGNVVPQNEWIRAEQKHEPIISTELWEKVQKMLNLRTRSIGCENSHLFAGVVKCGDCGRGMNRVTRTGTEVLLCGSYKRLGNKVCSSHSIRLNDLKQIVLEEINSIIRELADLERIGVDRKVRNNNTGTINRQIQNVKNQLSKKQEFKRSLYEDYREKLISREEYLEYKVQYETEIEALESQLKILEPKLSEDAQESIKMSWFQELKSTGELKVLDRDIILKFIQRINIFERGKIVIGYTFSDKLEDLKKMISPK